MSLNDYVRDTAFSPSELQTYEVDKFEATQHCRSPSWQEQMSVALRIL